MTKMYDQWRRLVAERKEIASEADWLLDDVWNREVALILSDLQAAELMIGEEFNADDLAWLSEIMDDLAQVPGCGSLFASMWSTARKFPEDCEKSYVFDSLEGAERLLDYLESKADASGGGTEPGEGDDGVQRRRVP